jgi:hypothetical protein
MKENDTNGACGTNGRIEKRIHGFSRKSMKGRNPLGDIGVGGRIILK